MSLTSLLLRPDVKEKFKSEFPYIRVYLEIQPKARLLSKNATIIGIACDYLIRFYLEWINESVIKREWIAAEGLNRVPGYNMEKAQKVFDVANQEYDRYLQGGIFTRELITSIIHLARLDLYARGAMEYCVIDYEASVKEFEDVDPLDVEDLTNIMTLLERDRFTTKSRCLLNPRFGVGSSMVGGVCRFYFG